MDFVDLLLKKKISQYRLSKISGIPRSTIVDICIGNTSLKKSTGLTLLKLSRALNVSIEDLLKLDRLDAIDPKTLSPIDESYLEAGLPKKVRLYLNGFKRAYINDNLGNLEYYLSLLVSEMKSAVMKEEMTLKQKRHIEEKYFSLLEKQ